jgi:hypothetical protein
MENESEFQAAQRLAGQVGRLQAEIMCVENFLNTMIKRDDVPEGVIAGATYYLKKINERREAGDI